MARWILSLKRPLLDSSWLLFSSIFTESMCFLVISLLSWFPWMSRSEIGAEFKNSCSIPVGFYFIVFHRVHISIDFEFAVGAEFKGSLALQYSINLCSIPAGCYCIDSHRFHTYIFLGFHEISLVSMDFEVRDWHRIKTKSCNTFARSQLATIS